MVRAFLAIALPRLLWSVGPLAFLVNVPFLQLGRRERPARRQRRGDEHAGAANVASVAAVAVAVGASPTAVAAARRTTPRWPSTPRAIPQ